MAVIEMEALGRRLRSAAASTAERMKDGGKKIVSAFQEQHHHLRGLRKQRLPHHRLRIGSDLRQEDFGLHRNEGDELEVVTADAGEALVYGRSGAADAVPAAVGYMLDNADGSSSDDVEERRRKEELGRATWTLLHTYAAALPAGRGGLSRRQRRDARDLVHLLSRVYPCSECAEHWADILRYARAAYTSHRGRVLPFCDTKSVGSRQDD